MFVIGTAGHVDHGKSSLVEALTGTNPDRWIEERLRGMTLDLGFAHLVLPGGVEAGIVDVPGHERFVHNMLAGAAGMDVVVLVVAANEGVMPQTREHLDILRFLNARRFVVALTKIDTIPVAERAAVRAQIAASLAGTVAADAPLVEVSSQTGEGLDALRALLAATLSALPPAPADAPLYLPVDRIFALQGLGTILTGTLVQGSVAAGETVRLEPSGLSARVRSLHVFGRPHERADAGARVALNLPGIDRDALARGEVVAGSELAVRSALTVDFTPLPEALAFLRRRNAVRAHLGSAQILGTLVLKVPLPPDARSVEAELHLRSPVATFPGLRFVLRRQSPKTLLGGGVVRAMAAAEPAIAAGAPARTPSEALVLQALAERGAVPATGADLAAQTNLRLPVVERALETLAADEEAVPVHKPDAYVSGQAARDVLTRALGALDAATGAEPWSMGLTSIAIARNLGLAENALVRILAAFVERGDLAFRAGYYARVGYQPALTAEQRRFFDELVPVAESDPFAPVPFDGVSAAARRATVPGAAKALETLLARGALVRVGEHVYRGSQIAKIHARVEEFLRANGRMTASQFRDLLGTSRKYAVPLLEWLDARGITIRSGDHRMLRKKSP